MRVEYPAVEDDDVEYPTLGPQVQEFIESHFTFGPGSLQGQPARLSDDQCRVLYRAYEHFPKGHKLYGMDMSGRRRFQRVSWSVRKGSAKTEFMAWVTGAELHPDAPVRWTGYDPTSAASTMWSTS